MQDDTKNINLKVIGDITDAQNKIKEVTREYENLLKLQEKVVQRGRSNNYTISAKDATNVRNSAGNVRENLNSLNQYRDYYANNRDALATSSGLSNVNLKDLDSTIKSINSTLKNFSKNAGYNSATGSLRNNSRMDEIRGFRVNNSSTFSTSHNASDRETIREQRLTAQSNLRDMKSRVGNLRGSAYRTRNNADVSIRNGVISYERNQEYRNSIDANRSRVDDYRAQLGMYNNRYTSRRDTLNSELNNINKNEQQGNYSSADRESANVRRQVIQEELKTIQKTIDGFNELSKSLDTAKATIDDTDNNLNTATSTGQATISSSRNSFGGILRNRKFSIIKSAVSGVSASVGSQFATGANSRLSSEDAINSIMIGQANQTGTTTSGSDNTILNNLSTTGIKNGTYYNSSQMAQFANAYASSTGNTSGYNGVANSWSQLSRFGNMGTSTTLALEQASGNSGSNASASLARVIQGEIVNSDMTAKASEQGQALSSLYSQYSQYGMTGLSAKRMASFQGEMATEGSTLQGTNGSQAYTAMASSLSNYSNPIAREMFGGNSAKYAGVNGQALLMRDMQQAQTDPTKYNTPMRNLLRSTGGNKLVASAQLSQMSNGAITVEQAEKMFNLQSKGAFNSKTLDRLLNKNSTSTGEGKSSYDSSGISSLNEKSSLASRAAEHLSESLDSLRKVADKLASTMNPTSLGVGTAVASGLGSAVGTVGSVALMSSLGGEGLSVGKLGGTLLAKGKSIFTSAKDGSLLNKVGKVGSATVSKGRDLIDLAKGTSIGGTILEKSSSIASSLKNSSILGSVIGKGKSVLSGVKGAVGASETLSKGSSILGGLAKVGGKFGSKILPGVGIAASGISLTNHLGKGNYVGAAGDLISGVGDGLSMTGIGAAVGVPVSLVGAGISAASDFFSGGSSSKGSSSKVAKIASTNKDSEKKHNTIYQQGLTLIKGFNDMLDKAQTIIAEAKSLNSGSSSSSSTDDSDDSSSSSGNLSTSALKSLISKAAKASGVNLTSAEESTILKRIEQESNGNQSVVNTTDSNAKNGTPSKGLLQYIDSTFKSYAVKGHTNIDSGYDQLLAMFNDSNWYKDISVSGGWGPTGSKVHALGGLYSTATPRGNGNIVGDKGLEAAIPLTAGYAQQGLNSVKSLAGMFGQKVVSNSDLQGLKGSTTSISPTYSVTIHSASQTATASDIASEVSKQLDSNTKKLSDSLLKYYSYETR